MRRTLVALTAVLMGVWLSGCGGRGSPEEAKSTPEPVVTSSLRNQPTARAPGKIAGDRGDREVADFAPAAEPAEAAGMEGLPEPAPSGEHFGYAASPARPPTSGPGAVAHGRVAAMPGPAPSGEPLGYASSAAHSPRMEAEAMAPPAAAEMPPASVPDPRMPEPPREPSGGRPARQDRQIQSGTLTAGSFDDIERFDDYRQFLSEAMQQDANERLPRLAIGDRVMIRISTADGKPVGDARVVVRPADFGQGPRAGENVEAEPLLDLPTGSDGRVMLLTGTDARGHGPAFRVTVHPPDGSPPVSQTMQLDQRPWRIGLPSAKAGLPKRLDLALVIDTTGSMQDELEYLKVEIDSIAEAVYEMFPNVDQRYALVLYRDEGDRYVTRTFDFTGSLEEFRTTLSEQSANGGGDYPEAVHLAMEHAGKLSWRRQQTARVLFLVGDAPPHDAFADRTLEAVSVLRSEGVRIFPVAGSGVAMEAEFVMRAASFLTLGQYLFLTDHSGVGNPHAKPHVPQYQVERLDRLMIRMIVAELAGRRLDADEVIAIEGGEQVVPQPEEIPAEQQPDSRVSAGTMKLPTIFFGVPRWTILATLLVGAACLGVIDAVRTKTRRQRL